MCLMPTIPTCILKNRKPPSSAQKKILDDATAQAKEIGAGNKGFATAVAGYGSLLRGDPYIAKAFNWDSVIDLANVAKGKDEFGYRAEFVSLARLAKTAANQQALKQPNVGGE